MLETSERYQVKEILKHYPYLLRSGHRTRHHADVLAVLQAPEQYQVSQVTTVHSEQSQHLTHCKSIGCNSFWQMTQPQLINQILTSLILSISKLSKTVINVKIVSSTTPSPLRHTSPISFIILKLLLTYQSSLSLTFWYFKATVWMIQIIIKTWIHCCCYRFLPYYDWVQCECPK